MAKHVGKFQKCNSKANNVIFCGFVIPVILCLNSAFSTYNCAEVTSLLHPHITRMEKIDTSTDLAFQTELFGKYQLQFFHSEKLVGIYNSGTIFLIFVEWKFHFN